MRIQYLEIDWEKARREFSREQLQDLWNQLLLKTSGDVPRALDILQDLWERYDLFDGEYTFEEFVEDLIERGMIRAKIDAPSGDGAGRGTYEERGRGREAPFPGGFELTARGERAIRQSSLNQIFGNLKSSGVGNHATPKEGHGGDPLAETRPFQPGDLSSDVDFVRSIHNNLRRTGLEDIDLGEQDLEIHEREHHASCATVVMIDVSHSMTLYGEDRITPAKQVAIALIELIQTRYPKDSIEVITFGDDAEIIPIRDLPYLRNGPYHTNTKAGLALAQRLLRKKRHPNKQIFMITDGKPSVIFEGGYLYKNSFGLDPKIVNRTLDEADACRRKGIEISTFMIADDPILVNFIDQLTKTNKGRAYFSSLDNLGGYIFTDYVTNRRRRVR